jgi:hypothetical protein
MAAASGISNLVAAQLSEAAYDTYEPNNLPTGWADQFQYYYNDGTNSFTTFLNASTQQIVVAFRGTQSESQLVSDVANQGGQEWESIKNQFAAVLAQLQAQFPNYQIMTDGHSLGGGMAQTAALENDLSGYAQNSLPISPDAIGDIRSTTSLAAALNTWSADGDTFSAATIHNDITTIAYAGDLNLYSNPRTSGNTSSTILPNIYARLEQDALNLAGDLDFSESATLYALAAESAHSISNVIAQLEADPSDVVSVPVAFLTTDPTDLNALPNGFSLSDSAANIQNAIGAIAADSANIQSIAFTDPGAPTLAIDFSQGGAVSTFISKIEGSYDLLVNDVTNQSFSSYEEDYVDGRLAVTEYFTPGAAADKSTQTDYNASGAYSGGAWITSGIVGKDYTGREQVFDAAGNRIAVEFTGVTGQSYTSYENDYAKSGAFAGVTYDVTSALGDPYAPGQTHYGAGGVLRWDSAELNNGGYNITGDANGVTLVSHGDDVMTGGGSNEKFVLAQTFGADTITDFATHATGADHDTISLSRADFSNFASVLSSATMVGNDTILTSHTGQTITLTGLNVGTLSDLSADFVFRG